MPFLMQFSERRPGRSPTRWLSIIGTLMTTLALLNLVGCSTTRLAYNNAPALAYWWLDNYFDFDSDQSVRMRNDLQNLQTWHRKEELPLVATELAGLKARALQNATTEQTCKLAADVQARAVAPLERWVASLGPLALGLSDAQLLNIERELDKRNRKWREEYLDVTPAERIDVRLKQTAERVESLYGRLRPEQMASLRAQMVASSYDAQTQYAESQRRHQDAVQVLRSIRSNKPDLAQTQSALLALLDRSFTSPNPAYRQYRATILQQGCATMTELHNSMTPEQRKKLQETLQGYEEDVRSLMAAR